MMVPLCFHWYWGSVPEEEQVRLTKLPSRTVFEGSPESVMRTSDGTAVGEVSKSAQYRLPVNGK